MRRGPFSVIGLRVPHAITASLAACALLLLSALPAAAQDMAPLSRLDPSSRNTVDLLLDSATNAGLPLRSLLSKVQEGLAKKIENRKIVEAVRKRLASLRLAKSAVGSANEDALNAAADVIEAGAKPEQLAPFKVHRKDNADLEAMAVWADFLSRGVPKEEAYTAITKLWADGADQPTFHSLWNAVQADILQGLNPGTALQNRIRETPRGPAQAGKPPEGAQETLSSR